MNGIVNILACARALVCYRPLAIARGLFPWLVVAAALSLLGRNPALRVVANLLCVFGFAFCISLFASIYAALAEKEREQISERTKVALQAAKARGKVLGNQKQADANAADARAFAEQLRDEVMPLIGLSSRKIAAHLNAAGIKTAQGGEWASKQVLRLMARPQEEATI